MRMRMIAKEDMIDGDRFEQLAQTLGLIYVQIHALDIEDIECYPGKVNVLSHNSDGGIVHRGKLLSSHRFDWEDVPDSVAYWFAQNADVRDDRLIPIPIGLERDRWYPRLRKKETILAIPRPECKEKLCYLNANTEVHVQREAVYKMFECKFWCTVERGKNGIAFDNYAQQIAAHKFVLCPDGNGMDTHRTWETLYLGSFPIVSRHVFTEEFAKILPILVVDDWDIISETFLYNKYDEFIHREWNWQALTMNYWENLIKEKI